MKRIILYFCLFATFLGLAQRADAQYATAVHQKHGKLVDGNGVALSDNDVLNLIGNEIYNETYLGAKKQCKVGRTLIWSGAAGMAVGMGMMMWGQELYTDSPYMQGIGTETEGKVGLALCVGGLLVHSLGSAALNVGIPLSIIGNKRLDWVVDNCNEGSDLTIKVGAAPNGFGLTVRF
jgi:hypothetical protein